MAFGLSVAIFGEFLVNVVRYGDIDVAFGIVPFQCDSTVEFSLPVFFHFLVKLEGLN